MINNNRDSNGRIKKGKSLNPSGRPKTDKLTAKDKKEYRDILAACIEKKDLGDAVLWLTERSSNTGEAFKYLKEFAGYIMPKLSSVKTDVTQVKELVISFAGEQPTVIEGELVKKEIENE